MIHDVDGQDKPGHDGDIRNNYFVASPKFEPFPQIARRRRRWNDTASPRDDG